MHTRQAICQLADSHLLKGQFFLADIPPGLIYNRRHFHNDILHLVYCL